jgi:hypothetical protein
LSAKTLIRLWYASRGGLDKRAFRLRYRPGRPRIEIDPIFLRLIAEYCLRERISLTQASRSLGKQPSAGFLAALHRRLPAREILDLVLLNRRITRESAQLKAKTQSLLQTIV